jgi:lysophospholipase L1-like esterase
MRAGSILALLAMSTLAAPAGAPANWVAAWAAAPADAGPMAYAAMAAGAFCNRTVRNVVHLSVSVQAVRVRLSNVLGTVTLTIDEVDAGIQKSGPSVVRGSNRAVMFGGNRRVVIPAGAIALSDPINLAVSQGQNVAVSIFSATAEGAVTVHPASFQDNFISTPGNFAAREDAAGYSTPARSWFILSGVEALAAPAVKGAIVAFGDSITDGDGSTPNLNRRWPDLLARRLASEPGGPPFAVVNLGIGGNRLLSNSPCFGIGALARLERDALSQTGVRAVILLEGINDIIQPTYASTHKSDRLAPCVNAPEVSADDLIAADRQIAAQVHAKGLKIYGGTVLPFQGFSAWTKAGEDKRQAINRWIKTGGAFDGVIDFAAAVADPANPARIASGKDSGDHVHPNDAGYAAMANAIDLSMLRRGLP